MISILPDVPDTGEGRGKEEAPKGGKPGFPTWAYGEQPCDCHPCGWRATEGERENEVVHHFRADHAASALFLMCRST